MKLKSLLKLSLISLAALPAVSFAQEYRNGMYHVAEMYDALYSRYGQSVQMRDAMARSDCGEIFTANSGGYSCASCGDRVVSQCAPVRAIDTAVIDGDSRNFLSQRQFDEVGQAVGSVVCTNPKTQEVFNSTAYLVASDVIKVSLHAPYKTEPDRKDPNIQKFVKEIDILKDCDFGLTNRALTKELVFKFKSKVSCGDPDIVRVSNCDWSFIKLDRPAPKSIKPLRLLAAPNAAALDNVPVIGVGHHHGAKVSGKEVEAKYKLIDFGTVKPKTSASYIRGQPHLIQYTLDTNGMSSGEPILIQIGGQMYVVASHLSEYRFANALDGKWNDSNHMNFGEVISKQMLEAAKSLAEPSEKYRFETPQIFDKPNAQIDI